jgi:hypothetical protein
MAAAAKGMLPGRFAKGVQVKTNNETGSVKVVVQVPTVIGSGHIATVNSEAQFESQTGGS